MKLSTLILRQLILISILIPIMGIAQDHYPRQRGFDVQSYIFNLKLSDDHDSIIGKASIALKLDASTKQIILDLIKSDATGKGMTVTGVESKNRELTYEHSQDLLKISYTEALSTPSVDTIVVFYRGVPRDGLIIAKNKHGKRTFFGDNWPNRAHHWLPVVDHPSEKAYVSFLVNYPNKYQCVSNGYLKEEIDIDEDTRSSLWVSTRELPVKVAVIGVAQFAVQTSGTVDGHNVSSWVYPQERENGFYDYAKCRDILEYFSNKIAAYPYEKLANVQSKTRYGGMENAGCIFYHENSIDGKRGSESLFAHELAHQWFGNSASEADWYHVWLSEGFATYLTEVYNGDSKGEQAFLDGMEKARKRVIAFQKKYPEGSTIDTTITDLNKLLSPMTYQRAAWFLHMLRTRVGDGVFWAGIKIYYNKFQFGNAYSDDFRKVMEEVSGIDLKLFFEKWLYQPGMVKMEIKWKYNKEKKRIYIDLEQPKQAWFPWSASLSIVDKNKRTTTTHIYHSNGHKLKLDYPMENEPEKVIFDPENVVLKW